MNPRPQRPDAQVTQAAAEWHALHRSGELSPAQQARFMAWLLGSPEHLREYLALGRLAAELGAALRDLPLQLPADDLATPSRNDNVVALPLRHTAPRAPARPAPRRWLPHLASAAVLLLALGTGVALGWPRTTHYATAHGAPRTFTLADGSVVHLNAESALSTRFSLLSRRVALERGQASFIVADERRPFSVHAAGLLVRDIGTTFDVSLLREQARIGVVEGRVQISAEGEGARLLADLGAGQGARIDYHDHQVRVANEDIAAMTGWWERRIVFRDELLREVADQFNRLNAVRIHADDAAGALRLTGNLAANDVDSLRAFLQQQPGLQTTLDSDGIRVAAVAGAKGNRRR